MKTRAKKGTASASQQDKEAQPASKIQQLDPSISNPPKVFILPQEASPAARIVTLPNPATAAPGRYFVCPDKGFYEFTRVAAPKRACKKSPDNGDALPPMADSNVARDDEGYVLQTADVMVATPLDPLFLLLPALSEDQRNGAAQMFLSTSDYLDRLGEQSAHFKELMRIDRQSGNTLEAMLERRMLVVCESMEAGDETLCKLSNEKLLKVLVGKARRVVEHGLPPSMEEHFVKQALVVPVMSVKREESGASMVVGEETQDAEAGASQDGSTAAGTLQSTESSSFTISSDSTTATSIVPTPTSQLSTSDGNIQHLLRLRTALDYLMASYVPMPLRTAFTSMLSGKADLIDFSPLDVHLAHLAKLKSEAQALRSLSENISRKRGLEDDDEALEKAEVKRKKKEDEEFRKKNMSRGVQQLKKADTSGMKKLSSFFGKAATKKA
ncbi:uncharacterized protein LTR77_005868 [Saxophila tyrrhenica]|uniref:Ribonuclease H2 subunit B n=1 Tax=Saxophila tyrrhenica TaxID=1690608 RepID=A0AAV9PAF8_9PEZI|nr:hypothetical protein LTR77_005868 [Saxophila tyrrhenica]